jgi:soluble lytic murein transglycosylase-like protein
VVLSDAERLATEIISATNAIRDGRDVEAMGRQQQVAYRRLVAHPEWLDTVVARVPADMRDAIRDNVAAGAELAALVKPKPTVPPWRIVAPAPADELLRYYHEAADAIGVRWEWLAAIHLVESRMGRIRGTSSAGALGPMQFLPATWARYGEGDINDNRDAIFTAARYLHANGAPENIDNALYHYNPTPHYVNAVKAYARVMAADPRTYRGYHAWEVYYRTTAGDLLLPVGYEQSVATPAEDYARRM